MPSDEDESAWAMLLTARLLNCIENIQVLRALLILLLGDETDPERDGEMDDPKNQNLLRSMLLRRLGSGSDKVCHLVQWA